MVRGGEHGGGMAQLVHGDSSAADDLRENEVERGRKVAGVLVKVRSAKNVVRTTHP